MNEEIPGDSLAATGTRFQRQIRTDRVRPPGNRSRASTGAIQPGQPRGHTRNSLSASSVSSIGSIYGNRDEIRRRPPPLVMAGTRLPFDSYSPADGPYSSGFSTPTSSRYSAGYDSPQWSSALGSPIRTSHSRTASIYAGHRTPGRRLSVPSADNPFQSAHSFGPSSFGQSPLTPLSSGSRESFTPSGSILASPTSSMGSAWSRRESLTSAADDYRRRTWHHPESQLGFTSRLQSVMTPGYYQAGPPQAGPSLSATKITLPGIESFDALPRPVTPPHRNPSPMMIDTPSRAPMHHHAEFPRSEERRSTIQWESNLPRNFTRLEIARPDDASAWASDVNRAVQERAQQAQAEPPLRAAAPRLNFGPAIYPEPPPARHHHHHHAHPASAPALTAREAKRQGWYAGPVAPPPTQRPHHHRTSPEGSSSSENGVPGTPTNPASPGGEYNPVIVQHAPHHHGAGGGAMPPYAAFPAAAMEMAARGKEDGGMMRLEALVAVATGERGDVAAAAY